MALRSSGCRHGKGSYLGPSSKKLVASQRRLSWRGDLSTWPVWALRLSPFYHRHNLLMIISHKHKFIFIKTMKTASTSIEIALSKFCGPQDIITPIKAKDEAVRQKLGYRGPQNYKIPLKRHSRIELLRAIRHRRKGSFYNHASGTFIKEHVDPHVWDSYYKFAFERNPWDKVISLYFWKCRNNPDISLSEFVDNGKVGSIRGFNLYSQYGEIIVDRVYLYENLDLAVEQLAERLKLPSKPTLPQAKSGVRKDQRSYRDVMSERERDKISKVFAREIAYFGYEW